MNRLLALAALAILLTLPGAAGARARNEPQATSPPALHQQGTQLVLDNGGWFSYSGPVDRYVFRFQRDGQLVKGAAAVPKTLAWGSAPLPGEYPDDATANVLQLTTGDDGHVFCGDVYAGTHSRYVLPDGTVAYDVIEWGHTLARDGSPIPWTCITAHVAAPVQPNPAAAAASIKAALGEAAASAWRKANPGEWQQLLRYNDDPSARPALRTPIGRALTLAVDASWYSRGRLEAHQ